MIGVTNRVQDGTSRKAHTTELNQEGHGVDHHVDVGSQEVVVHDGNGLEDEDVNELRDGCC